MDSGTLWTRGDPVDSGTGEPGPSVLLAWPCLWTRAASVLLCPALVRGTMEALQHVPALELQLQVRGGAAGHAQPCQPSPSPHQAHASQSTGGQPSEGPRVLMGRAPGPSSSRRCGRWRVTRGQKASKPCRPPPEGTAGSLEPLEAWQERAGLPSLLWERPALCTIPCSLHPDLALRVAAWQQEGAPPGPARGGTTVIQGGLCLSSWWVEMWGPQGPWKPRKPDLTPLVAPWWPLQCSPASSGDGAVELWSGPTQDQVPGRALQGPLHTLELVPTGHQDTPHP